MTSPDYDLEAVRAQIPILATHVPMNACSQAPQSAPVRAAADAYLASWNEAGMDWDAWIAETEAARAEFAGLIGGAAEDVAVATSVSQATSSIATAMKWNGPRNGVVASAAEFPTVGHVWLAQKRSGAEVRWVPDGERGTTLENWAEHIDQRTRIVSACHGGYQTGVKQDIDGIAELAHDRGALLYVDAYQTLGTEPFDAPASGADFVASGNLKYLMGMPGIAFLWIRPGLTDALTPTVTGWFGRLEPFAFDAGTLDWGPGGHRFDLGTPPIMEAYVARAGMGWLRALGMEAIGAWTGRLRAHCVERALELGMRVMGPTDPAHRTPSTAIVCDDAYGVESALRAERIIASARGPVIRLAPHFYNTLDDVDQALDALARAMRR
jgi:selenocysteine lyase/cysteine desulfurase